MKIEHIALYVKNLEDTKNFFMKYLGPKSNDGYYNPRTNFRSYFLSFDAGYAHIAFSVCSKEKVDALTEKLKMDGYEVISGPRTTGDGYYESCIIAIEGNLIEITI